MAGAVADCAGASDATRHVIASSVTETVGVDDADGVALAALDDRAPLLTNLDAEDGTADGDDVDVVELIDEAELGGEGNWLVDDVVVVVSGVSVCSELHADSTNPSTSKAAMPVRRFADKAANVSARRRRCRANVTLSTSGRSR